MPDAEGDAAEVGLRLALVLERLGRRQRALDALWRARSRVPTDARIRLTRAKLLFRFGSKQDAAEELDTLIAAWACKQGHAATVESSLPDEIEHLEAMGASMTERMAGAVFYIRGWVAIHDDNHSLAYTIWSEGASNVPSDPRLARQRAKVACWLPGNSAMIAADGPPAPELLGAGAYGDGTFDATTDAVRHCVPEGTHEPALALFDPTSQDRGVVFTSKRPLLTHSECEAVIRAVDSYVETTLGGKWGTVRRSSVKTTDVAVEDVPALRPWLRSLLSSRIFPMLASCFPRLADGGDMGRAHVSPDDGTIVLSGHRLRVHDAFIVRYDARPGGPASFSLPEHSDTSAVSVSLALNEGNGVDFEGGGTWIRCLKDTPCEGVVHIPAGHATAFAGPLRHGGHPVTAG